MKRISVFLISLVLFLALVSCEVPVTSENDPEDILPGEGAYVRVMLPTFDNVRSISLEDTKQLTDFYEVTFKRTDTETPEYFSANASAEEEYIEIRVPVGQYDILLFAGNKLGGSPAKPLLLASAYKQGQNIVLEGSNFTMDETTNIINLNLELMEFVITPAHGSVLEAEKPFEAKVRINFHNPLIEFGNVDVGIRLVNYVDDSVIGSHYYDPLTGDHFFTKSWVAGVDGEGGGLYVNCPSIKPFGYGDDTDLWILETDSGPFLEDFRSYFVFRMPQANINITWPEE